MTLHWYNIADDNRHLLAEILATEGGSETRSNWAFLPYDVARRYRAIFVMFVEVPPVYRYAFEE